jgi:hypothetical protein
MHRGENSMFEIGLLIIRQTQIVPSLAEREYDAELDDVTSVLDDICEALSATGNLAFQVQGFGQSPWPVSVEVDLATILPQLPDMLEWLNSPDQNPFRLSFYEQGIERQLLFSRAGEQFRIVCESWGRWVPDIGEEFIGRASLVQMMSSFARTFIEEATRICPGLTQHEWFQEWCGRVTRQLDRMAS